MLTAYQKTENNCRQHLIEAYVDVNLFRRKLSPCKGECRGMCCYEGTFFSEEDATIIQAVARTEAKFFASIGLQLPETVVTDNPYYDNKTNHEWIGISGSKSMKTRPVTYFSSVEEFPPHFKHTACVFLTESGYCGLQLLAVSQDLHPWYYKPFLCWLCPITILSSSMLSIELPNADTDTYQDENHPGYYTYTLCGKTRKNGISAFIVLEKELEFLGKIIGRDLNSEIRNSKDLT